MTPPFPTGLDASAARRQAIALLALFYVVIYGGGFLLGRLRESMAAPFLSALILGTFMLAVVWLYVRRDASWRDSLGFTPLPAGPVLGWSILGFLGTYVVNITLVGLYLTANPDLDALAAHRATWMGRLAEVPAAAIIPLAAFAALWEETVFRGFVLGRLRASLPAEDSRRRLRDAAAIIITALCFGAGHGYQGTLGLIQTTVAGMALGTLVVWRKSIWPAMGAHLAIDAFGLVVVKGLKPYLPALLDSLH